MNVKELKELAKERGVKGYYKMKKEELEKILHVKKEEKKVKPCKPGYYRHPDTNRCRKNPKTSPENKVKPCKPGYYRHPDTNRCRKNPKTSPENKVKPCKPGYYRHPDTNRCRKNPKKSPCPIVSPSVSPKIKLVSPPKKFKTKTFLGVNAIDTYASILYLAELFKDECIIIPHLSDSKFKIDKDANFHDITLSWDEKSNLLWEPVNFWKYMKECDKSAKRFIMIPFGFDCKIGSNSHANFLIYDKYENTLERFEPHGNFNYNSCTRRDIDDILKTVFRENFNSKIKYFKPVDYLPNKGFQSIQEEERKYKLFGFCGIWSAYYAILRLNNPDVDRKVVVEKAIKELNKRSESYSEFIRDYGQIVKKISKILYYSKSPEKEFADYIIDLNQDK